DATVSTRGNLDNSGLIAARGNVSLQASGAQSQINNTNTGILAAGLESNGSLANTGQLTVSATQGITASGRHFSGGDQSFSSRMVDLSGSQTSARQLTVTATQDDVNLSNSTVLVSQTLNVNVRQTWRTDAANISAQQITASAHTLSNELGQIVQTGSGDLTLNLAGLLNNNRGRIAVNSANLDLNANTLNNANGSIEHAGTGNLSLNATTIEGTGGSVASNGVLNLMAASATLDAATTLAQQININSTTLQHRAGKLTQTGSGATILTVSGQLDNSNGLIISNGATTLTLGHLNNQGGVIQTAGSVATPLTLNVVNSLDNSQAGNISAKGSVNISANHLNNHQGQINAGQTLTVTTPQQIDNSQGVLVANGAVNITASQISNQSGLVGSVQEGVQLTATSGTLNNLSGRIEAAQTVSLTARGINNTDGSITGKSLSADSQNQQFDNTRGRLLTTGTTGADSLNLQTAGFNNDRGLIQAASALTLDTQGQTLTNTNAGSSGGIVGQSAVNLITGDINNQAGYIGSTAALTINAAAMANNQGGSVVSSGNLTLNAQSVNNQGGQVQALSHVQVTLNGSLENSGGVVRSGQDLGIQATSINNSNTQGSNQGLEGNNVNLTVPSLDNSAGAIRANNNVILSSSGSLNNSQGLMSAGHTLTLQDAAVSKTLAITNTGGTLLAGQQLTLDGARLSGDGDVLSEGHLNIQLRQSLTNTGRIVANGNATVETTATLTNRSTLAAGNQLHAKAATLDNQAGGSISAARVKLEATSPNTLINRGLINGVDTILETQTLNNLGTGKIYGDTIAIGATTVTNGLENGVAPVIAARNRLDIGAVTIENQENAMLFSAGDLAIGGSLDANKRATGQATTLNNASGTIEALGNADISAKTINNTNLHFRYETQVESVQHDVREDLTSRQYRVFTRTISSPVVTYSKPAQLIVGGNLRISTDGAVQNYMSHIVSGGVLTVVGGSIENIQVYAPRYVQDVGTTYTLVHIPQSGRCGRIRINCRPARDEWWTSGYDSTTSTTVPVLQTTTPQGSGTQVVGLTSVSLNASPGAAGNASGATQLGQNFTPITQVTLPQGSNATGPATVVRSGGINTSVPNSRLFSFNPNPTGQYFIETDPQFANYRNWLSSNYMLNALALDPAATQKRLGDGFYEQKLIREQIAQLTGRRLLDGYADDESQYSALMNQGVTFARAHQLVPGVALSAEQMAQLTS
ncbi:MAG: S-layer family protein, partial [Burkholderiales bacterium]|nr:S-layer family protein [Burkholderiales bacterium]